MRERERERERESFNGKITAIFKDNSTKNRVLQAPARDEFGLHCTEWTWSIRGGR
jgi:hypothetical protein